MPFCLHRFFTAMNFQCTLQASLRLVFGVVLFCLLPLLPLFSQSSQQNTPNSATQASVRIRVAVVGDFMCHDSQIKAALQNDGTYDFSGCYEHIAPMITKADFAFGNLETVLAGKAQEYTGYPAFNSPNAYAAAIQQAGFDALTTANNHSFDRQYFGVKRTLYVLDSLKIPYTGTTESQKERSKPLVVDVRGIKLGIIAYTYGLNGGALSEQYRSTVNVIDTVAIRADIRALQSLPLAERPDIILVSLHWGAEYQLQPSAAQRNVADWLFREGAHALLGAHPHVVQTVENKRFVRIVQRNLDTIMFPAIYSMGNFISGQRTKPRETGVVAWLEIEKTAEGSTKIVGVGYTPTYIDKRPNEAGRTAFRVLNVPKALKEYEQNPKAYPANIAKRLKDIMREIGKQFATPDNSFQLVEE